MKAFVYHYSLPSRALLDQVWLMINSTLPLIPGSIDSRTVTKSLHIFSCNSRPLCTEQRKSVVFFSLLYGGDLTSFAGYSVT